MPCLNQSLIIAQISDCHLFAQTSGKHCGVNVYKNLVAVLQEISENSDIDYVIATGDITQDHSEQSYQLFVDALNNSGINIPVLYLSGNHDDPQRLRSYFSAAPFCQDKNIESEFWQIILLNSKSETPAGFISSADLSQLSQQIDKTKSQLVFMHHHPVNVGYFIDKHNIINADEVWQTIEKHASIKGLACGHIHRGLTLLPAQTKRSTPVYTCPATSIQFDPLATGVKALNKGAGYRLFYLDKKGKLSTKLHSLEIIK